MGKLMDVTTMDNYYEQIVVKKMSSGKKGIIICAFVAVIIAIEGCVLFAAAFPPLAFLALALMGVIAYLIYYVISNLKVEYEYTFVTGEMRVERIKRQLKRRKVCAFDVKAIDDIGKYNDRKTGQRNIDISKYNLILRAEDDDLNPGTYYVLIHDKIRHKPAILIFSPDETTLQKLRPYLSIELKKKFMNIMNEEKLYAKKVQAEPQET